MLVLDLGNMKVGSNSGGTSEFLARPLITRQKAIKGSSRAEAGHARAYILQVHRGLAI